jgi:hypothetical protein
LSKIAQFGQQKRESATLRPIRQLASRDPDKGGHYHNQTGCHRVMQSDMERLSGTYLEFDREEKKKGTNI